MLLFLQQIRYGWGNLISMHSESASQNPLLVVLAHPDDEFAIFPWLRKAIHVGRHVDVIWLTDGGWGGQNVMRRHAESTAVLAVLGMKQTGMHLCGIEWGIPDGRLHQHLETAVQKALQHFGTADVGGEVMMPAWEGGHQDHDASHLVGIQLAKARGARMSQFSLYHGEGLRGTWFKILTPLPSNGNVEVITTSLLERLYYAALCLRYPSQWKSFMGLLPFYLYRMFNRNAFRCQAVDPLRVMRRPHEGALLYERRSGLTWDAFAEATAAFRNFDVPYGC